MKLEKNGTKIDEQQIFGSGSRRGMFDFSERLVEWRVLLTIVGRACSVVGNFRKILAARSTGA